MLQINMNYNRALRDFFIERLQQTLNETRRVHWIRNLRFYSKTFHLKSIKKKMVRMSEVDMSRAIPVIITGQSLYCFAHKFEVH
jgi:hypothetical protein